MEVNGERSTRASSRAGIEGGVEQKREPKDKKQNMRPMAPDELPGDGEVDILQERWM